ncbi:MAG: threonine aldolase [Bacillota bacterium]|nr:threonine aldolase [Bacillota bacterium]
MYDRRVDLRSDTVTKPTPEMRRAMYEAEVGDDVYREDPTVNRLEEVGAARLGKEAGLFVTSGTQGNLIAILTHTQPGQEVILEQESHIYYYEVAGSALIGGVQLRPLQGKDGALDPAEVEASIRPDNIHYPDTGLIVLENTHNRAGGTIIPGENIEAIARIAARHNLPLHLDGARIFNAAIALGKPVVELARPFTSVMFCLSKGLGAPVGSLLVGPRDWIEKARKWRKRLGGGMRQAGILAAAGLVALEKMVDRLAEDHENARRLAEGLGNLPGLSVVPPQTNMVLVDVSATGFSAPTFVARLAQYGVLAVDMSPSKVRFVTHKDVDREDIEYALRAVEKLIKGD